MEEVTTEELLWAADALLQPSIMLEERLRALPPSTLATKLMSKVSTATGGTLSVLLAKGYTLETLPKKDETLTAKALLQAGIIKSYDDVCALGVKTLGNFVDWVGPPFKVRSWLKEHKGVWKEQFSDKIALTTYEKWFPWRQHLTPKDLKALHFSLGRELELHMKKLRRHSTNKWLAQGTRDEWIKTGQLSAEQYDMLTSSSSPPQQQQQQQQLQNSVVKGGLLIKPPTKGDY